MNRSNLNQNEPKVETKNITPQTTNEIELPKFASEEKSIGTLKKDTQKSPVAMLILFGILIAVIYFAITFSLSKLISIMEKRLNYVRN